MNGHIQKKFQWWKTKIWKRWQQLTNEDVGEMETDYQNLSELCLSQHHYEQFKKTTKKILGNILFERRLFIEYNEKTKQKIHVCKIIPPI